MWGVAISPILFLVTSLLFVSMPNKSDVHQMTVAELDAVAEEEALSDYPFDANKPEKVEHVWSVLYADAEEEDTAEDDTTEDAEPEAASQSDTEYDPEAFEDGEAEVNAALLGRRPACKPYVLDHTSVTEEAYRDYKTYHVDMPRAHMDALQSLDKSVVRSWVELD